MIELSDEEAKFVVNELGNLSWILAAAISGSEGNNPTQRGGNTVARLREIKRIQNIIQIRIDTTTKP